MSPRLKYIAVLLCALACLGPSAIGRDPAALQRVSVLPSAIEISGRDRQQQLVVTGIRADGSQIDLTHIAVTRVLDPSIATIDAALLSGLQEGETQVRIEAGESVTTIPLRVSNFSSYPPIHFEGDVLPLFSKLGCNSGGCHGKQSGQNGFRLSVFGFDPRADYDALVREGRGRRVFPGAIEHSLIYTKAVGISAHGGGQRMSAESQDAQLLREWIRQGMPWGSEQAAKVEKITVQPQLRVMSPRSQQQLRVVATYSDGQTRDVTRAAAYSSNDTVISDCDSRGVIQTGKVAGEAAITISYMGFVDVSRIVIPQSGAPVPVRPEWFTNENPIDDLVWNKWQQLRIAPSDLCDDATFFRRVMVKTTGTLPRVEQVRRFIADSSPGKRAEAIERALASTEFTNYWTQRWSDILMVNSKSIGGRGAYVFHQWIRQQIQTNRPYDEWVYDIIVASGNSGQVGPANFYRGQRTPEDATRTVSQAFLGVRMDCTQCHHHPFEKWGQDDFYGLAGYFNGMTRQKLDENRDLIYHPGHKPISVPVVNRLVQTRPLDGSPTPADDRTDPRPELAKWVTSPENPFFSRLVANRLWKHLMGRGLVEPEDDLRETNPPTNPELLDHLAETLKASDFDLKALMRHVLSSTAFQLSSQSTDSNYDDDQTFSHYLVRRLPAEVMLDAICQVTGVPEPYPGHPPGARAIELWDNQLPSYFLDTFGRSLRESPCECGSSGEPTMAQALHLLNAPEIEAKIQDDHGLVFALSESDYDVGELIEHVALATVNRLPTAREKQTGTQLLQNPSRREGLEDFLWVMMNSYDFLFVK
jgi:hypothetical protein